MIEALIGAAAVGVADAGATRAREQQHAVAFAVLDRHPGQHVGDAGPIARDADAEAAREARVGPGHVRCHGLVSRRDHLDAALHAAARRDGGRCRPRSRRTSRRPRASASRRGSRRPSSRPWLPPWLAAAIAAARRASLVPLPLVKTQPAAAAPGRGRTGRARRPDCRAARDRHMLPRPDGSAWRPPWVRGGVVGADREGFGVEPAADEGGSHARSLEARARGLRRNFEAARDGYPGGGEAHRDRGAGRRRSRARGARSPPRPAARSSPRSTRRSPAASSMRST